MDTASRVVEITIISGEGLRINSKRSVKKNAFVVVRTDPKISEMTKVDTEGGSYSAWKDKLVMDLPAHASFLSVEVYCRSSSGDKLVGAARVPVSDFSGGLTPAGYLHFLSYRLRNPQGEKNGIVNLSVRMKTKGPEGVRPGMTEPARRWPETVVGEGGCSGVVTGVPVPNWYAYAYQTVRA